MHQSPEPGHNRFLPQRSTEDGTGSALHQLSLPFWIVPIFFRRFLAAQVDTTRGSDEAGMTKFDWNGAGADTRYG